MTEEEVKKRKLEIADELAGYIEKLNFLKNTPPEKWRFTRKFLETRIEKLKNVLANADSLAAGNIRRKE